jgi:hypothetical protein
MNMYLMWALSLVAVYVLKDQIHMLLANLWQRLMNKIKG